MPEDQESIQESKIERINEKRAAGGMGFWLDIALNIIIIVGLVFIIRSYIISPFQVFGPSMCDTLNNVDGTCQRSYGEYIIVNKLGYQNFFGWQIGLPKRGDIVVFHPPQNKEEYFIKRVIGLPGETIKLQNGEVYLFNDEYPEGFELEELYLNAENSGSTIPKGGETIFEIPAGHFFVMGDNRKYSSDSRHCFSESAFSSECKAESDSHFLPFQNIEGKAWVILWPVNKLAVIKDPEYKFEAMPKTTDAEGEKIPVKRAV